MLANEAVIYVYIHIHIDRYIHMRQVVAQLCVTLGDSVDCSLPGSSVHGNLQPRILVWVAISFSRGSFLSRDAYVCVCVYMCVCVCVCMCVCVCYMYTICAIYFTSFFLSLNIMLCLPHFCSCMQPDSLVIFFFTQSMKLQGNQNYTDSSKKRTEWVRESICISAPSKLLPLAASSLLLSVSGPVLYQGITKDQTCVLLGLLLLRKGDLSQGRGTDSHEL